MGGVRLFGRRWSVSTDDFVFSSIIELLMRTIWLVILLVVTFVFVERTSHCNSYHIYRIFCFGLATSLVINIPLTVGLMVTSARGSILRDRHKRLPWVPIFLYAKLLVYATEIGWVIFGLYWAFYDETNCDWSSVIVVRIMVVAALIVALFNAVNVWVIFDPLGTDHGGADRVVKTHKVWERRCRILCCGCAPKDREKDAFTSIAHILTDYFVQTGDMDLTPSDIAAGLLLLRRRQEEEMPMVAHGVTEFSEVVSVNDDLDVNWAQVVTISYFMKYALACYGWPIYMMMNFCSGCCRLCGMCRCCGGCCAEADEGEPKIIDDNCCSCNFAAILKVTGLPRSQFLYVTFHNDLFESPYFVAVDHEKRTLIVAVRGSLSASDGLTDLAAVVGCLEPEGHPTFVVHGGILQSARYISQRLLESRILENAFARYQDYRLVLCGHSLGAGIVSVLAVLLRQHYPGVKAYAFSPPLGLMNKDMSEFCQDFVVSVSLGYDLVTHLSIRNMYFLKQRVLDELHNTDQAKYKIVAKGLFRFCCGNWLSTRPRSPSGEDPLLETSSAGRTYNTTHDSPSEIEENASQMVGQTRLLAEQMDMQFAGRMLHIVDISDSKYGLPHEDEVEVQFVEPNDLTSLLYHPEKEVDLSCLGLGQRHYKAVWSTAEHFREIMIHPRMITDHLPDRVGKALHYLVNNQVKALRVNEVAS